MGLTLIHGNSQEHSKPRVIVVAEPSVHAALSSDLELDVYPECFDYDSFVKASLSKSISTNNTIIVLSDAMSQRVAPLEAVIALVRSNVVLIPWKSTDEEIATLNVATSTARPTANTLRRAIFEHCGMNDLPPRFDGDDHIEEPPDARVMELRTPEVPQEPRAQDPQATISRDDHSSPLDWFSTGTQDVVDAQATKEAIYEDIPAAKDYSDAVFLPPQQIERLENQQAQERAREHGESLPQENVGVNTSTSWDSEPATSTEVVPSQEEESFFLPEFLGAQSKKPEPEVQEAPAPVSKKIDAFWNDTPEDAPLVSPSESSSDSLELEAYVTSDSDKSAYENIEEMSTTVLSDPDMAFSAPDANGSQQMWTMFDTNTEVNAAAQPSFSEFPDGSDNRKNVPLAEPLVLCVYSPKGGVGKTSISVNLAARLAYTTRLQVCIVDLDIAFGNVGTRLGLYNPTVRELLNEPHIDGESLARNLVYDRRSGLFALLAPLRPETGVNRRKFSPAAYKKILSMLKERFDVVILDCPVELRDPLVSGFALVEAGQVVMVVNNEQATLLDARRAIEAMCRPKDSQRLPGLGIDPHNVGMVVNQKVDNVGREVDDIKAILGGGDPNHPSREIEILSVIADDRQLWVGNANMARTVATSGENDVDTLLDDIWGHILPDEAAHEFESQEFNPSASHPLDDIFANDRGSEKKKKKFSLFKKDHS